MLKCHLEKETGTGKICVKGNPIEILADVTLLINDVYNVFRGKGPIMGDFFRTMLRDAVNDDSSPVWKESDTDEAEKHGVNNVSIRIPRAMQELLDDLREAAEHDE